MTYQHRADLAQAAGESCDSLTDDARLAAANINPGTRLATDYLNHFNEAIMLLEMMASHPECRDDLLQWRPMSYHEHFVASHFRDRDLAIAAYETADPAVRNNLDVLAEAMTALLQSVVAQLQGTMSEEAATQLAGGAAAALRPLVARAGAVINGKTENAPARDVQSAIDILFSR